MLLQVFILALVYGVGNFFLLGILLQSFLLIISVVGLYYGAEMTLEGAEKIGHQLGFSPLVVGVIIVGFGTSLPEFFVTQLAALEGHPQLAVGNIVGSNIANLFLILGVTGLIAPLNFSKKEIKKQVYLHLGISISLVLTLLRPRIDIISSCFLFIFFVYYIASSLGLFKKEKEKEKEKKEKMGLTENLKKRAKKKKVNLNILDFTYLIVGLYLLYFAGSLLVTAGTHLGPLLGISEYVISAVFVAFGTSFPELVTSIVACKKKKNIDLILGNILGSNFFNVALVLGSIGLYNVKNEGHYYLEFGSLLAASLIFIIKNHFKTQFHRFTGMAFLTSYLFILLYWAQKA